MLRLVVDEKFNNDVLSGLLRRNSAVDVLRVQDTEMSGAEAPEVLAWAAIEARVLVTLNVPAITPFAYARVRRREAMPGVVQVPRSVAIRRAIEDLLILAECGEPSDLEGRVLFLPLEE